MHKGWEFQRAATRALDEAVYDGLFLLFACACALQERSQREQFDVLVTVTLLLSFFHMSLVAYQRNGRPTAAGAKPEAQRAILLWVCRCIGHVGVFAALTYIPHKALSPSDESDVGDMQPPDALSGPYVCVAPATILRQHCRAQGGSVLDSNREVEGAILKQATGDGWETFDSDGTTHGVCPKDACFVESTLMCTVQKDACSLCAGSWQDCGLDASHTCSFQPSPGECYQQCHCTAASWDTAAEQGLLGGGSEWKQQYYWMWMPAFVIVFAGSSFAATARASKPKEEPAPSNLHERAKEVAKAKAVRAAVHAADAARKAAAAAVDKSALPTVELGPRTLKFMKEALKDANKNYTQNNVTQNNVQNNDNRTFVTRNIQMPLIVRADAPEIHERLDRLEEVFTTNNATAAAEFATLAERLISAVQTQRVIDLTHILAQKQNTKLDAMQSEIANMNQAQKDEFETRRKEREQELAAVREADEEKLSQIALLRNTITKVQSEVNQVHLVSNTGNQHTEQVLQKSLQRFENLLTADREEIKRSLQSLKGDKYTTNGFKRKLRSLMVEHSKELRQNVKKITQTLSETTREAQEAWESNMNLSQKIDTQLRALKVHDTNIQNQLTTSLNNERAIMAKLKSFEPVKIQDALANLRVAHNHQIALLRYLQTKQDKTSQGKEEELKRLQTALADKAETQKALDAIGNRIDKNKRMQNLGINYLKKQMKAAQNASKALRAQSTKSFKNIDLQLQNIRNTQESPTVDDRNTKEWYESTFPEAQEAFKFNDAFNDKLAEQSKVTSKDVTQLTANIAALQELLESVLFVNAGKEGATKQENEGTTNEGVTNEGATKKGATKEEGATNEGATATNEEGATIQGATNEGATKKGATKEEGATIQGATNEDYERQVEIIVQQFNTQDTSTNPTEVRLLCSALFINVEPGGPRNFGTFAELKAHTCQKFNAVDKISWEGYLQGIAKAIEFFNKRNSKLTTPLEYQTQLDNLCYDAAKEAKAAANAAANAAAKTATGFAELAKTAKFAAEAKEGRLNAKKKVEEGIAAARNKTKEEEQAARIEREQKTTKDRENRQIEENWQREERERFADVARKAQKKQEKARRRWKLKHKGTSSKKSGTANKEKAGKLRVRVRVSSKKSGTANKEKAGKHKKGTSKLRRRRTIIQNNKNEGQ